MEQLCTRPECEGPLNEWGTCTLCGYQHEHIEFAIAPEIGADGQQLGQAVSQDGRVLSKGAVQRFLLFTA